jgi:hypothetical protein
MNRRRLEGMALGVGLAVAAAGCGYPQFSFTGAGGSGGASSSHSGGGAGAPCQVLHDTADCGASGRCTVVDTTTGALGCVTVSSSPQMQFDACTDDQMCAAGTWCNLLTLVCSPFCDSASGCGDGACIGAVDASDTPIPGITVCTAHCDPIQASPCGSGATCVYDPDDSQFDCAASAFVPVDMSCEQSSDCGRGLVCAGDASGGLCVPWCEPVNTQPDNCGGGYCDPLAGAGTSPITYDGTVYGYCGD